MIEIINGIQYIKIELNGMSVKIADKSEKISALYDGLTVKVDIIDGGMFGETKVNHHFLIPLKHLESFNKHSWKK